VWNGLTFQQEQAHFYNYNFRMENATSGFGACRFTAQAFADLDADGLYSTFERSGSADVNGVNAAAGLYIDHVIE
jgi:type IV pilus assembly protein PilA